VHSANPRSRSQANDLSVRLELSSHFFAGRGGPNQAKNKGILEAGDIEEALARGQRCWRQSAATSGAGPRVVPDSFTHGTSGAKSSLVSQRPRHRDYKQGDTFNAKSL